MKIERKWAMPNSKTFRIEPIRDLILRYVKENDKVLDPFANEMNIKSVLPTKNYISNDLDPEFETDYHMDAQEFLEMFEDNSIDVILYDPPYSYRQVSECYKKLDKTVTMSDTNASFFTRFKKEISGILKPNGIVITCGWNTNGVGATYGMDMIEVLVVAHGGGHYDTLVTVEKKKVDLFTFDCVEE